MTRTVARRITGANKEPLGGGLGDRRERGNSSRHDGAHETGGDTKESFAFSANLQNYQYQAQGSATDYSGRAAHLQPIQQSGAMFSNTSMPAANRYLPPTPIVDQPDADPLAGNGVDFPKCFHCARWKIDVCRAVRSTECQAVCAYCHTTEHNGKASSVSLHQRHY